MSQELRVQVNNLTEAVNRMQKEIIALAAVNQVLSEIAFEANPKFKTLTADALQQILDREDIVSNKKELAYVLQQVLEAARNPSRMTPDGRRQWLKVLNDPEF